MCTALHCTVQCTQTRRCLSEVFMPKAKGQHFYHARMLFTLYPIVCTHPHSTHPSTWWQIFLHRPVLNVRHSGANGQSEWGRVVKKGIARRREGEGRIPGPGMEMTGAQEQPHSVSRPWLWQTPASMGHEPVMVLPCPSHFTPYLHYIL